MTRTLNYDHHEGLARAILTENGQVSECFFDRLAQPQETGAVYRGQIDRQMAKGKSAFVNMNGRSGFLSDAEGLQAGDSLLVQIKGEARENKAPGLGRWISLPGLYLIYQPYDEDGIHFSRRLGEGGAALQDKLQPILSEHGGGWVVRRAALHAPTEAIAQEAAELAACADHLDATPDDAGLCLSAPSAFEQAILGHGGDKLDICVEAGTDLTAVTGYLRVARPSLLAKLNIKQVSRAFDQHDLESFFAALKAREVPLPQGGSLMFDATPTLQVVDVNGSTRTHFLDVNREAARLLMQHLRWRNIGGLIVVDFLKMKQPDDKRDVADYIRELAGMDTAPCDVYGFTRMGLCEISRARRGFSLAELLA